MAPNKLHHILLKEWLRCVQSEDFNLADIFLQNDNNENIHNENINNNGDRSEFQVIDTKLAVSASEEEDHEYELIFKDGAKYIGGLENGLGKGHAELQLPETEDSSEGERIIRGYFMNGVLHGSTTLVDNRQCTSTLIIFRNGIRHGPYRIFLRGGTLIQYGFYRNGKLDGSQLRIGSGDNSYYIGDMDEKQRYQGNVIYLYPNLTKAIIGEYKNGRLVEGHYAKLINAFMGDEIGFPTLEFTTTGTQSIKYDPSTFLRISRTPLVKDEYETETVYVKDSRIPFAGEGLYAARTIGEGELVCLFNGYRITKNNCKRSIMYGDEDWSDFRLTLDKCTDLDIPEDSQNTKDYCATLGHKACHSFKEKNSMFHDFEHPRFGEIMSIVALKNIRKDEEILVSYNYSLGCAPPWYQQQWVQYLKDRGLSKEAIWKLKEKEESKSGIAIPDHLF